MNAEIKADIDRMSNACEFLCWLAWSLTALKLIGVLSWSWFFVLLPVTFPILFFATVGAITLGGLAAFFFIELATVRMKRPTTRRPPL